MGTETWAKSRSRNIHIGEVFGRWTVIGSMVMVRGKTRNRSAYLCRCECGTEKTVVAHNLLKGTARSCGCYNTDQLRNRRHTCVGIFANRFQQGRITHGQSGTHLYKIWKNMVARCECPGSSRFQNYGARGIQVCREWRESPESFMAWADRNGYEPHLSLERKDVDGNYEPSNCTWIPLEHQARNRQDSRRLTAFGEIKTLTEWGRDQRSLVGRSGLQRRLNMGWSLEQAITTPPVGWGGLKR